MKEQIEVPALVGDIALQMENSDCTPHVVLGRR
jgi:hypothetical protein